jgi:hypothetical protein
VLPVQVDDTSGERARVESSPPLQAYAPNPASFLAPARRPRGGSHVWLAALALAGLVLMGTAAVYFGNHAEASRPGATSEASEPLLPDAPATNEVVSGLSARSAAPAHDAEGSATSAAEGAAAAPPALPLGAPEEPTALEEPSELQATEPSPRRAPPARAAVSFLLSIVSTPPRATVTEGGKVLGRTPLRLTIERAAVARAPREFVLQSPGYLPYRLSQPDSKTHVRASVVLSPGRSGAEEPVSEELETPRDGSDDMSSATPRPRRPDLEIRLRR